MLTCQHDWFEYDSDSGVEKSSQQAALRHEHWSYKWKKLVGDILINIVIVPFQKNKYVALGFECCVTEWNLWLLKSLMEYKLIINHNAIMLIFIKHLPVKYFSIFFYSTAKHKMIYFAWNWKFKYDEEVKLCRVKIRQPFSCVSARFVWLETARLQAMLVSASYMNKNKIIGAIFWVSKTRKPYEPCE